MFVVPQLAQARSPRRAVPDLRRSSGDAAATRTHRRMVRIPIVVHMATYEGFDVASKSRVGAWVKRANEAFEPHGIEVYVQAVRRLPAGFSSVRKSKQRRSLAGFARHDGAVHLFVTQSLDLAKPRWARRRVRGLHWRYRGISRELRRREYVVVTTQAPDTTLAHEVGHLLGLRHSTSEDNIMCSCRTGDVMGFSWTQGNAMRMGATSYLNRHRQARRAGKRRADRRRR